MCVQCIGSEVPSLMCKYVKIHLFFSVLLWVFGFSICICWCHDSMMFNIRFRFSSYIWFSPFDILSVARWVWAIAGKEARVVLHEHQEQFHTSRGWWTGREKDQMAKRSPVQPFSLLTLPFFLSLSLSTSLSFSPSSSLSVSQVASWAAELLDRRNLRNQNQIPPTSTWVSIPPVVGPEEL